MAELTLDTIISILFQRGFEAGVAAILLWWLISRLDRKLDEIKTAIENLNHRTDAMMNRMLDIIERLAREREKGES